MSIVNEIAVICPSRGRNDILKRCITSWKETTDGQSDFHVILDNDDKDNYEKQENINYFEIERCFPCQTFNYVLPNIINNYKYFFVINDDNLFKTCNWESIMIEASSDFNYYGVVFPNDLYQYDKLSSFPMFGYKAVKHLNWLMPLFIKSGYADVIIYNLFLRSNLIKYVPNVILEHLHWSYKKGFIDNTFNEKSSYYSEDELSKDKWLHSRMNEDVSSLIDAYLMDEL